MKINVLLVDDHNIIRIGLRALIEKQPNLQVLAEASNGRDAVKLVREMKPDVVIMDVAMPDMNGIEATRQILAENSNTIVVALSMHSDRRFVTRMFEAGALGYLLKDCAFEELTLAIKTVTDHQIYLSPQIPGIVLADVVKNLPSQDISIFSRLSRREREVLQLLAEGKSTKQNAKLLHVSAKTIESHRAQIMEKLNIHSIAELTKFAIREGLTSIEAGVRTLPSDLRVFNKTV
jgi:DNA-binding NarL/FixJ family response regulator